MAKKKKSQTEGWLDAIQQQGDARRRVPQEEPTPVKLLRRSLAYLDGYNQDWDNEDTRTLASDIREELERVDGNSSADLLEDQADDESYD